MRAVLITQDPVLISCVRAALAEEGIESFLFDEGMNNAEGGISAFPRRLMVVDDDFEAARAIVEEIEKGVSE